MNLQFLVRSLHAGGAERQVVVLAKALARAGHRIEVLSFYSGGPFADELAAAGIRVTPLEKRGRWDLAQFLVRLHSAVRRAAPDALLSYLPVPNIVASMIRRTLPRTRVILGVRYSSINFADYDWATKLSYGTEPVLSRLADAVIVNSRAGLRNAVRIGFDERKLVYVPNGFETDRFRPALEEGRALRAEWGVQDEPIIGLVGRTDPVKDHETFLRAAARVRSRFPRLKVVCVGGGRRSERDRLCAFISSLRLDDSVRWIDHASQLSALYSAFDVSVLSSRSEGFPNVVAEAMACGTPCAVTDVGDAAEIVAHTGAVVPPGEPDFLARAVIEMLALPTAKRRELGAAARRRVESEFSVDRLVDRTLAVIRAGYPLSGRLEN